MDQHVGLIDNCHDMAEFLVMALNRTMEKQEPSKHRFAVVTKANIQNAVIAIRVDNKIFEIHMETLTTRAGKCVL